jgi:hypothetical protein
MSLKESTGQAFNAYIRGRAKTFRAEYHIIPKSVSTCFNWIMLPSAFA